MSSSPPTFAVPEGFEPATAWNAGELARLAAALAERGPEALARVPLARRIEIWGATVAAFLDPESPERRLLFPALVESSRLSAEGLCEACEVILGGVGEPQARELAADAPGPARRALAGVVLAGNIPGLLVQSLLPALLVGRPLLVKSASDEPYFAAAFLRALRDREPAFAEAFAAASWSGAEAPLARAAFEPAEKVLAYGGAGAISGLRALLGERLVAHGPKASVALVDASVDPLLVARKLARDIVLFDQRGCLSVQAVYTDGDAGALAEALAWALALEHRRLPPGPLDPRAAAAVQQLRAEAEMRGLRIEATKLAVGTVIVERGDPEFRPVPGLRTVRIHALPELSSAIHALAPWRGRLQGAALAGPAAWSLQPELEALEISRCAAAGELQHTDAGWRNGGIDALELFR